MRTVRHHGSYSIWPAGNAARPAWYVCQGDHEGYGSCRRLGNPMSKISRRKFTRVISSPRLAGTAPLEQMFAEVQHSGSVSLASMRSFLRLSGTRVLEDQLA